MSSQIARVFINEIEVGSLPATQFKKIVSDGWRDPWLYGAQLFNIVESSVFVLIRVIRLIPFLWFAVFSAFVLLQPTTVAETLSQLLVLPPTDFVKMFKFLLLAGAIPAYLFCLVAPKRHGDRHGFSDKFLAETSRQVRQILEVPTEGFMRIEFSGE